jgi:hypothetical protein
MILLYLWSLECAVKTKKDRLLLVVDMVLIPCLKSGYISRDFFKNNIVFCHEFFRK